MKPFASAPHRANCVHAGSEAVRRARFPHPPLVASWSLIFSARASLVAAAVSTALLIPQSAFAVDYTWDGGGGDNVWGTGANWMGDISPIPGSGNSLIFAGTTRLTPQYNYGDGDDFQDITFDSTAGAFTISNTGTNGIDWFGSITNNSANTQTIGFRLYQAASNVINASSGNITLNSSALLFRNGQALTLTAASGKTIQIDSVIADGSGGAGSAIVINGAGTVRLNGANTFTSGVNVSSGSLSISANNNLGANAAPVTLNGGTLTTTAGITNTHAFTIGASGGTINVTTTGQYFFNTANTLLGSGALTVTGNGTLTANTGNLRVAQTNTYSGNLIINSGGIFEWGVTNALGSTAITIGNQGEFALNNGVTLGSGVGITVTGGTNSVLSFENGTTGNYASAITLDAGLTVGLRDWYNHATVRGGTVSGVIQNGTNGAQGITVNSGSGMGGTLTLTNANTYTGTTTISSSILQLGNGGTTGALSASSAITNNGTLTINRSNAVAQGTDFSSAAITGTGAFVQAGAGTTTLNTANTFTGSTTLTAGTLSVADTSYLGGATANNNIVFNGGTLQVTGTTMTSFGSHTVSYNASKTVGFDINNAANNFNAGSTAFAAGSTDTLLKTGAGTLTLGAASNTIKTVQLDEGTLDLGSNNLTISNAGSLTINNATTNSVTINATGGGKIVLGQNNATDGPDIGAANGGTLTINAAITGTSAFENWTGTANGTGVTVLTGANDYTGNTIINGGVLSVSNIGNTGSTTSNLGQSSTISLGTNNAATSTGTLRYTGAGETSNRTISLLGTTVGGTIDQSGASGNLKFTSNLSVGFAGTKTLTLQGSTGGTGEFAGNIVNGSGTVAVTKAGTGAWTLSGANTYTGQTTVSAGTLNYSGTLSSAGQINVGIAGGGNAVMNVVTGANIAINAASNTNVLIGNGTTTTTGQGFLYQSGGNISNAGAYTQLQIGAGNGAYGYYNLSGAGTLSVNEIDVGGFSGASAGVMDMSGGTATIASNGWLIANRTGGSGGIGILNLTGGTLNYNGPATQFQNNWGSNGTAVINVSNAMLTAANADINLNQSNNSTNFGAINLLTGGTLQAHSIAPTANGTKLVNFNGGTLKASTTSATFLTTNITAVNVYGNGGTIDNNGVSITIPASMLAPSGNGVTAGGATITGGSGYLGAPAVTFSGGGGTGATGYVTISGGVITSLVITNPGTGYTSAPTVNLTGGGGASGAITLAAPVANGSGGMTYTGAGTTTLTGANSSYTGATTINAGTLGVSSLANGGSNSNIGASTSAAANLILNGGTLQYTGGAISTDRLFSLQSDSTLNASGSGAMNFTNTGAMGFNGGTAAKTLTLTGTNTGANMLAAVIGNNTGQTSVTKTGAGTWVLTGSNTYTGTTAINGGILNVATLANGGSASAIGAGASTVGLLTFNGGTLQYTGSTAQSTNHLFTINSSGATLDGSGTGSGTMSFTNTGSLSGGTGATARALTLTGSNTGDNLLASGIVDGSAAVGVTKTGLGKWALSGSNTYTGATAINGGTLEFQAASAMSGTSALTISNGGTLSLKADADTAFVPSSIAAQSGAITVNITAGALSAGSNKTLTLGNSSVGLTLTGDNTVNVTTSNGYTLAIPFLSLLQTVNDSTIQTLNVASGSTLQVTTVTANDVNNRLRFTGAGNTMITGAITQAQANRGMGLVFDQTGTVTLSGTTTDLRNNTNGGSDKNVVLNSGTVNFNSNNAIRSTQAVTFNIAGGAVNNTSGNAVMLTRLGTTNINGDFAFGGTNDLNLGTDAFTLGTANGSTRTITTNGTAALTIGGVITSNGVTPNNIRKDGAGTLVLSGNSAATYLGATTVDAGKLSVNGSIAGSSAITVNSGGTLLLTGAGSDRVGDGAGLALAAGTLAVASGSSEGAAATMVGGSLSGANGIGLGALTLSASSTLDFDSLGASTLLAFTSFAPGSFTLNVTNWSNANFDGTLNSGLATDDRFVVNQDLAAANLLSSINFGSGLTTTQLALGGGFYEIGGLAAIPEPDTIFAAVALLGLAGLGGRRRLRRKAHGRSMPLGSRSHGTGELFGVVDVRTT